LYARELHAEWKINFMYALAEAVIKKIVKNAE
jgi:hypothetical protein